MADVAITTPSDSAANPQHPDHQRWVKSTLVEEECKRLQEAGVMPPVRAIEEDISETYRKVLREQAEGGGKTPERVKGPREPEKSAQRAAEEFCGKFYKAKAIKREIASAACHCGTGACPRCKLEFRVRMLMQIDPQALMQLELKKRRLSIPDDFMYPRFAMEIVQVSAMAERSEGPFKGKGPRQRDKIVNRMLQDICDRSRSLPGLGEWQ